MKTINYEDWFEKYKPIKNTISDTDSYDNTAFETYGDDLEFIKSQPDNNIWTLISSENEEFWIIPGFHYVDRFLYFVTEIPWKSEDIQVNDNEMLTNLEAKEACIDFLKKFNIKTSINQVSDFFTLNYDNTFENSMSVSKAKYLTIEYYETFIGEDLPSEMGNQIHDFFNNLK